MTFGEALELYRSQLEGNPALKATSKLYPRECIEALVKSWPDLKELDVRWIPERDCLSWASRAPGPTPRRCTTTRWEPCGRCSRWRKSQGNRAWSSLHDQLRRTEPLAEMEASLAPRPFASGTVRQGPETFIVLQPAPEIPLLARLQTERQLGPSLRPGPATW
jgi:hypothetical protein